MQPSDLTVAAMSLNRGNFSLVLVRNGTLLTSSHGRGVKPLLELLEEEQFCLTEASLGDKVVGRAAALLAIRGNIQGIYASVISRPALDVCRYHGTNVAFARQVPGIINRSGTGPCPMEALTASITDPQEALEKIKEKLRDLEAMKNSRGQQ